MSHYIPNELFSIDTNPKTIKGQKLGYITAVLYLAPSNISGYQVCPMAKMANCENACLYKAGRGAFNATQKARINKTQYYFADKIGFMRQIAINIHRLIIKGAKLDLIPLVRMNGTSDIKWENVPISIDDKTAKIIDKKAGIYTNIFSVFPEIQFYDYTKIPSRDNSIPNYDLTYSYSGASGYIKYVTQAINNGMRIAVVFRNENIIPKEFLGIHVVPGDNSDIRHLDPKGSIIALYAKGPGKKDNSGFVVDAPKIIPIKLAA
jgi:hypothetical protein